jgi:hypothetical protein
MVNNLKSLVSFILLISIIILNSCSDNPGQEDEKQKAPNSAIQNVPTSPIKNGIVLFIDKTSSLVNVKPEEADKGIEWLLEKIMPQIEASGGELVIYFIHKSSNGASPYLRSKLAVPDTKGMVAFKRLKAQEEFKKNCDSLKSEIRKAVHVQRKKDSGEETDLFASLKKANDILSAATAYENKMILYYSDMIESVKDTKCGRNYEKIYFKTVEQAKDAGKKDAAPIRTCLSVNKLPQNTSVHIFIPNGALDTQKHQHVPDYWKALFGEFGVTNITHNL